MEITRTIELKIRRDEDSVDFCDCCDYCGYRTLSFMPTFIVNLFFLCLIVDQHKNMRVLTQLEAMLKRKWIL